MYYAYILYVGNLLKSFWRVSIHYSRNQVKCVAIIILQIRFLFNYLYRNLENWNRYKLHSIKKEGHFYDFDLVPHLWNSQTLKFT